MRCPVSQALALASPLPPILNPSRLSVKKSAAPAEQDPEFDAAYARARAYWAACAQGDAQALRGMIAEDGDYMRFFTRLRGDRPLAVAARKGHAECIRILLSEPAWTQNRAHPQDELKALILAASAGHAECAALLATVASPDAFDERGFNAFLAAASCGSLECLRALAPRSTPRTCGGHGPIRGWTALHCAAAGGHLDCVEFLLPPADALGGVRIDAKRAVIRDKEAGWSALMLAATRDNLACVEALLPWSDPRQASERGKTALMLAAERGDLAATRLLLPGSDPRVLDSEGHSALSRALSRGHAECAALLLPVSDPSIVVNDGSNGLLLALRGGDHDCVRLMLGHGDPGRANGRGDTAISLALASRDERVAALFFPANGATLPAAHPLREALKERFFSALKPAGANEDALRRLLTLFSDSLDTPEFANEDGYNALFVAALVSPASVLQTVLPFFDARAQDAEGRTPLMLAVALGRSGPARFLIPHSDLRAADKEGNTALLHAALAHKDNYPIRDIVDALLAAGGDPNAIDLEGRNALMVLLDEKARDDGLVAMLAPLTNMAQRDIHGRCALDIMAERESWQHFDALCGHAPLDQVESSAVRFLAGLGHRRAAARLEAAQLASHLQASALSRPSAGGDVASGEPAAADAKAQLLDAPPALRARRTRSL